MPQYHVAQVNIGRIRAELTDPIMAGFMNRLDEINALADASPGFVWRLKTEENNATYFRPFNDERTLAEHVGMEGHRFAARVCVSNRASRSAAAAPGVV